MRALVSWIREFAHLDADVTTDQLAARLTALGLKLEALHRPADEIQGPLVVGRVLTMEPEPQKNGKTINWCSVDVGSANGTGEPQWIVCGAHNFAAGDLVVCVLPGGVLPGGFAISARKTYGHVSAGMICSAAELGLGEDHDGIIVLPADAGEPGDDAIGVLRLDQETIEFEINPDRAYALSMRGVGREAALGFEADFTDPADRAEPASDEVAYPVEVEDPSGCPVFSGRSVSGFDPAAPTPPWMAERISAAGMRPISLAVDVTNYVMLELGQPIHGFDRTRLSGPIRVRRARAGERLTTLDGKDRELHVEDLLITDDSGPIGLAGVMGGETTELGPDTTDIFIEAAHWDPVSIFRTERRHKLPSEAAKRFERGTDPAITLVAADRVAELLVEHGGGRVDPGVTHVGTVPEREVIVLDSGLSARVSGIAIDGDRVRETLAAIGCDVQAHDGPTTPQHGQDVVLDVTAPTWRPDLTQPYDLVEEIVRVVGYDRVPSILPKRATGRGLTQTQRLRRRVGRHLAGAGAVEVISFPFVGDAVLDRLGIPADDSRRDLVELANPISSEEPYYTATLLPGLVKAAARNVSRGSAGAALFEIGAVATGRQRGAAPILGVADRPSAEDEQALYRAVPDQPLHAAGIVAGELEPAGEWGPARAAGWRDALALARGVAEACGIAVEVAGAELAPFHPGRCARLELGDGTLVGYAGELHPKVCEEFDLPARSAAFEVDLDAVIAVAPTSVRAPHFSAFPVAKADVALVVDESVTSASIVAALEAGAGDLLESVRLFDVYRGDPVPEGRKSCAFALRFRASDRTLTDDEVEAARAAAIDEAARKVDAVLR